MTKTVMVLPAMAVLGMRPLMLTFGGNSDSFMVGLREKCSWRGGNTGVHVEDMDKWVSM